MTYESDTWDSGQDGLKAGATEGSIGDSALFTFIIELEYPKFASVSLSFPLDATKPGATIQLSNYMFNTPAVAYYPDITKPAEAIPLGSIKGELTIGIKSSLIPGGSLSL